MAKVAKLTTFGWVTGDAVRRALAEAERDKLTSGVARLLFDQYGFPVQLGWGYITVYVVPEERQS